MALSMIKKTMPVEEGVMQRGPRPNKGKTVRAVMKVQTALSKIQDWFYCQIPTVVIRIAPH